MKLKNKYSKQKIYIYIAIKSLTIYNQQIIWYF
jgi:hypothetical protein